jgi:hypothetical protein
MFKSAVPFKGPMLIAIYSFTGVLAIAAAGDAKVVLSGALSGPPRIARRAAGLLSSSVPAGDPAGLLDDPRAPHRLGATRCSRGRGMSSVSGRRQTRPAVAEAVACANSV